MVSTATVIGIVAQFLIAIGIPVILVIYFKRNFDISLKVLLMGMLTFLVFAYILEQIVHVYVLGINKTTKELFENPWLFTAYGGLMAGIFEETGRLVFMKFALKKYREWKDGLSFGLGHGGFEAIALVGLNSIMMLVFAALINSGTFDAMMTDDVMREAMAPIKEQLTEAPAYGYWLGGIERLSAIAIHIALSILVLYAIVQKKMGYFFLSILLHAIINIPAGLYQAGVIENIFIIELFFIIFAAVAVIWTLKSRKLFRTE